MGRRQELQTLLENLLVTEEEPDKKLKVYFQPPANVKMEYPCIVYQRNDQDTEFANNKPYHSCQGYQATVIDRDPDSIIVGMVTALPMSRYNRFFVAENLNHDVFSLYF
jgi:hypothetical protein